jgi:glycosyltransferase involved in cell wall biosynthesis
MMQRTILFLIPYPLHEAPSQRFRFEQYFQVLRENGFGIEVQSFLHKENWKILYQRGMYFKKILTLFSGISSRFRILFSIYKYDFIFIHRETMPLGPPVMEWIIAKVCRKRIIYDFDDAIWLTDKVGEGRFMRWLKGRGKVSDICLWSYKVSCGNHFLCEYAYRFNENVFLIPTTVDTEETHNPDLVQGSDSSVTLGWTGSTSTLKYLEILEPVLNRIQAKYPSVKMIVIADKKPNLNIPNLEFVPWAKETEIRDLKRIRIGVMPLPNDEWANGKCGFKAIQYMSLQIPPVISPVGMNCQLVDDGKDGFLAADENEWFTCLEKLINDPSLRRSMGELARQKIITHYSVISNRSSFLRLFA